MKKSVSVRSSAILSVPMNLPVSIAVLLARTDVPSAGLGSLDGYELGSALQRTVDVEVLLVRKGLNPPAVGGVLGRPLQGEVRISPKASRCGNGPSGSHPH